jgi:hypothetical protein
MVHSGVFELKQPGAPSEQLGDLNSTADSPDGSFTADPLSPRCSEKVRSECSSAGIPASPAHLPGEHRGSQTFRRTSSLTPAQIYYLSSRSSSLTAWSTSQTTPDPNELRIDAGKECADYQLLQDPYFPPVPTTKCFQQFKRVVARKVDPKVEASKENRLQFFRQEQEIHRRILNKLRKWAAWKTQAESIPGSLKQLFKWNPAVHPPTHDEIFALARHHYPLRSELTIYVCDFGDGRFEKMEVKFCDIDPGMQSRSI